MLGIVMFARLEFTLPLALDHTRHFGVHVMNRSASRPKLSVMIITYATGRVLPTNSGVVAVPTLQLGYDPEPPKQNLIFACIHFFSQLQ